MFKNNNNNNKKALTSSVPNANLISSSAIFNYFQWHFELIFGHAFFYSHNKNQFYVAQQETNFIQLIFYCSDFLLIILC